MAQICAVGERGGHKSFIFLRPDGAYSAKQSDAKAKEERQVRFSVLQTNWVIPCVSVS